ncbi:hypothetical protein [Mycolicibacterium austroafricanum]|uniref:hypothetical protein n=1 Tax=Mycolicibacterium austroafricanum TaxID=39687 RepID=UPI000559D0B6|nr:hypothetical protein [Mycolicibacterium austroafricanum]
MQLRHICEVCGTDAVLDCEAAHAAGWDYPPHMGAFTIVSARTCPNCPIQQTVWWALVIDGFTTDMLTDAQRTTVARILGEPASIAVPESGDENGT